MLDPVLQSELKKANRTVLFLHIAMLGEPFIYVIVALALKQAGGFEGTEGSQPVVPLLRSVFLLVSALAVLGIFFLRRLLFAPERLIPAGADAGKISAAYSRAQVVVDALAVVPATLGFVLFLLGGSMEVFVALSAVSIVVLVFLFPRYETLEEAAVSRTLKGEATQQAGGGLGGNA